MDYREEFYSFLKEEKKLKENSISSYRHDVEAVSYTHLDVYKRQRLKNSA